MRDHLTPSLVIATASLIAVCAVSSCAKGLPALPSDTTDAAVDTVTDDETPLDLEPDLVAHEVSNDPDLPPVDVVDTDPAEDLPPTAQSPELTDTREVLDPTEQPDGDSTPDEVVADEVADEVDVEDEPPDRDCPSGTIERLEECDDGDDFPNDGCSVDCLIERGWSCDGEPSECVAIPLPPRTRGEASTNTSRPSWIWLEPESTAGYRVRIDEGEWTELPLDVRLYTAEVDLELGSHVFEVQAKNVQDAWSFSARFTTVVERFPRTGYWTGVARDVSGTPLGRPVLAVCQQCFTVEAGASRDETIGDILTAMGQGVDIVDLWIKGEGGNLYVDDLDTGGTDGVLLADIMSAATTTSAEFLIRLTVSEETIEASFAESVLDLIDSERERVARNGRPIIVQLPYAKREYLPIFVTELSGGTYPFIERYVRLHVSFDLDELPSTADFQTALTALADEGAGAVVFHAHQTELFALLQTARSLGLAIEVSDLPEDDASLVTAMLREDVDAIALQSNLAEPRAAIGADNQLVYLNTSSVETDAFQIDYQRTDAERHSVSVGGTGEPTLQDFGSGGPLFGTALAFDHEKEQVLSLYDGDHTAGVFVAMVAQFGDLDGIGTREERGLVSKAGEADGWTFDIRGGVLRFGVYVDDEWVYATYPTALFNEDRSYAIIGAYGGDGKVHLLVDFDTDFVATSFPFGDVTANDVPITLGANVNSELQPEEYSSGVIQMLQIQSWEDH